MAKKRDSFFADEYPASKKQGKAKKVVKKGVQKERPKLDILWVSILVIVAFAAGVLVRHFVPIGSTTPKTETGTETQQQAPALTPEQIEKGEMPPGHPTITGPGTSTPSGTSP